MNTPTPEQIAKVARHVGYDVENTAGGVVRVWLKAGNFGSTLRDWDPINNPADRMDLQDRVRVMGYDVQLFGRSSPGCRLTFEAPETTGFGSDDAHALFWAVWQLVEA